MDNSLLWMLQKQWELEKTFRPIEAANGFIPELPDPEIFFPVDINADPSAQWLINDAIFRVIGELMEAAQELKNKPWKQSKRESNDGAFEEELIDAWHFMLRLMLIVFGRPEKAYAAILGIYAHKAAINKKRQEDGV